MAEWTYDYDSDLRGLAEVLERHLRPDFTFVNIGANDGVNSDPVWLFATTHGWQGVCVEPAPPVFERLEANYRPYPRVQVVQAAISREPRQFWYIDDPDYVTNQIGSLDRGRVEASLRDMAYFPEFEIHVPTGTQPDVPVDPVRRGEPTIVGADVVCLTFEELVERCGFERVDLVNIDVEGADWEVLSMIDLDAARTSVVIVETAGTPEEDRIRAHLADQGFEFRRPFGIFSTVWERDPFPEGPEIPALGT